MHNRLVCQLLVRSASLLSALACALGIAAALAQGEQPSSLDAVSPISASLCAEMRTHRVLNRGSPVGCDRLRLVQFGYIGFDQQLHGDGRIVVMDALAEHVMQIFASLRERKFPIARAQPMTRYDGNDEASMADNNTSAFNVRQVAGGSSISVHAYGAAVDINPVQNPYVRRAGRSFAVSPRAGMAYLNRRNVREGMVEPVIEVFAEHGLSVWGGCWRNFTDYQHFQINRGLAGELAHMSAKDAKATFDRHVDHVRTCRRATGRMTGSFRGPCSAACS